MHEEIWVVERKSNHLFYFIYHVHGIMEGGGFVMYLFEKYINTRGNNTSVGNIF